MFFTTGKELHPGPHRLDVVYGGSSNQTPLSLDYLIVTNTSMSNSTSPGSSSSPTSTTQASSNAGSSKTPVGAIVGGVLGGIVAIGLVIFILLFVRRRRRRDVRPMHGDMTAVTACNSLSAATGAAAPNPADTPATSDAISSVRPYPLSITSSQGISTTDPPTSISQSNPLPNMGTGRRGKNLVRLEHLPDNAVDLPPRYSMD